MGIQYEFVGQGNLVKVTWAGPQKFDDRIYDAFFMGREAMVNDDNEWVWVKVMPEEWVRYLLTMHELMKDSGFRMAELFYKVEVEAFAAWYTGDYLLMGESSSYAPPRGNVLQA